MQRSISLTLTGAAALILTTISLYLTVRAHNLSLPTSTIGHCLAIALPIALPIITYICSRPAPSRVALPVSSNRRAILSRIPIISTATTILFMLDTVLLTISSAALESSTFSCALETQWHHLFQTKNADAIRNIQDALECCGLRTTVHEAWPFPPTGIQTCAERYNRKIACEAPWSAAGRKVWGGMVGVAAASVVIKVLILILMRNQPGWFGGAKRGNRHIVQRTITGGGDEPAVEGQRYLDEPEEAADDEAEEGAREGQRVFASNLGQ